MISKEEREKDKQIAERVETPLPWKWWTSCSHRRLSSAATGKDGDVAYGHTHKDGCGDIVIRERDMAHLENAANRLPEYIADAEEMERRITKIVHALNAQESGERAGGDRGRASDGLREALRILRGAT